MKTKKNKKADLSKKSLLFFQLGLILSLFLVWQLIEWKAEAKISDQQDMVYMDSFEQEEVPITVVEEVKPPEPLVQLTEEVKVIDDELKVEESVIAPTEPNDEAIVEVAEVEFVEEKEEVDYNILSVEEVPIFPGCENAGNNEARRACFGEKVTKIVGRTFDADLGSDLGLSGIHRIYVTFKIEKDGSINIIGARGSHPKLEEEAIRVVKTFPDVIPGKQGGRPVGVIYTLPILLRIAQ